MAQLSRMHLADGGTLAYRQTGAAEAVPVLLIHSLAMTGAFWSPVADHLASSGYRVIAPDCRGHGASSIMAGLTVERAADDMAELLDHLGIEAACVAGASMGGSIALAFTIRHPARTLALGLVDTTAWYGANAPTAWEDRARKAKSEGLTSLVDFQVTRWFSDGFRDAHREIVDEAVATFLGNDLDGYAAACRMLGACDVRPGLSAIAAPTAIVVGEEDYATPPAMAQAMADAISGSEFTILAGLRHLTPLEAPELVADHLAAVFGRATGDERRAAR